VRRELAGVLKEAGIGVRASHHENSPGQQEICLEHETPIKLADNIMTFRLLTKLVAAKHGLKASFMPKPLYGVNDSGMHPHFSLHRPEQSVSEAETMSFMAGILSNHLQAKGIEWDIYRQQIHQWEYEQYLDKY
jgi:glutamine synthetase